MKLFHPNAKLFKDFLFFGRTQMENKDIDPVYPVLKWLQQRWDVMPGGSTLTKKEAEELRFRFSLLYVAYYNLPSAMLVWKECGVDWDRMSSYASRQPTGVERRALRGGKNMVRHLLSLLSIVEAHGSAGEWFKSMWGDSGQRNWGHLQQTLRDAWGNGRWAAYKSTEVLLEVNGLSPLIPVDMGNEGSTGPRKGLELLFGQESGGDVALMDDWGWRLWALLVEEGLKLNIAQVETLCCDFYSMHRGHYYPGKDIDDMLAQLNKCPDEDVRQWLLKARLAVLPVEYLGEQFGWEGPDKARCRAYLSTGRILKRRA